MGQSKTLKISGREGAIRLESSLLESLIQRAIREGYRSIEVEAYGQHGIGGRLWRAGNEPVYVRITGSTGQRVGSMGFPNTTIEIEGPASDDVGWLNAGATIIVHGQATNGVANAMAQGRIYIAGDVGARAMTMTKHNPRFEPPELWVLGGVGDFFGEFMAGGKTVICGYESGYENVLGYRPCVGMVGGEVFFRGKHRGFSEADVLLIDVSDADWLWLTEGIRRFLQAIRKPELFSLLASRKDWQKLRARKPFEKLSNTRRSMTAFVAEVWNKELDGGLLKDLLNEERTQIPLLPSGDLRRYRPRWDNEGSIAPCQSACPTGIPVRKRWGYIRRGEMEKAVDIALQYTPFPATVCGYLCPNLCMQGCTRTLAKLPAIDVRVLGKASLTAKTPTAAAPTGVKIAVIGGGAAGISAAWQLFLLGHEPTIYEQREDIGGKITASIPFSRIPGEIIEQELARVRENIPYTQLLLDKEGFAKLQCENDFVIIAVGAQKARRLRVEGSELALDASEFLRRSKGGTLEIGEKVLIIGAGNVGCNVASEAAHWGAREIMLVDVQKPASFGVEREHAEAAGAKFLWPKFTQRITKQGVEFTDGSFLEADTVVVAIGDTPDLDFLPPEIATKGGFIVVDGAFRTSAARVFAIGDVVRLGLLTEAIGAGRIAVRAIDDEIKGRNETYDQLPPFEPTRIHSEYYPPAHVTLDSIDANAHSCFSCGSCRDCGVCVAICPEGAIERSELAGGEFEYHIDDNLCIGCGFCAGACPCGIWQLEENTPI